MKIIAVLFLFLTVSCEITSPVQDNHLIAEDFIGIKSIYAPNIIYTPYLPYYGDIFNTEESRNVIYITLENNNSNKYYNVMLEGYIEGISNKSVKQEYINPNQTISIGLRPVIEPEIASSILETREAVYHVTLKVSTGDTVFYPIFQESYNIKLTPYNTAVFEFSTNDGIIDAWDYLAMWSTPNIVEIDTFILNDAASRHPKRHIVGYQDLIGYTRDQVVMSQVRAIYNSISSLGILYVNNFLSFSGNQKIKYPKQVLNSKTANCIESTMLFASVLEAAGFQPIVIITDDHAFVGWRMWKDSDVIAFLETVFSLDSPAKSFDDAFEAGSLLYNYENERNNFATGDAYLLDIGEIRKQNITPFPLTKKNFSK